MSIKLIDAVITSREDQGAGVAVMEIARKDGEKMPAFEAGAHIDVHIDDELVRQYSLSNAPGHPAKYRIGVLNDPATRGGSIKIWSEFKAGREIKISEPRNHFPLDLNAQRTILAGGGIGITPMLAMAYKLRELNKEFELHYCTRTKHAGAFSQELEQEFPGKVFFHYDDGQPEQLFSPAVNLVPVESNTHVYVCGPTGFMDWVIESAKSLGFPSNQVHFEYFSAEVDTSGSSFEVYCAQSDMTVQVGEEDTIARALKAAGIAVDVSCEEGVCGTCITDVLEGEPDHRDHFLTDEEKEDNDQMALCCSRAKSAKLTIDI